MSAYRVRWEIDIEASDPKAAAVIADDLRTDPDSEATYYTVVDENDVVTEVDLSAGGLLEELTGDTYDLPFAKIIESQSVKDLGIIHDSAFLEFLWGKKLSEPSTVELDHFRQLASELFKVPYNEVTETMRWVAKSSSFGERFGSDAKIAAPTTPVGLAGFQRLSKNFESGQVSQSGCEAHTKLDLVIDAPGVKGTFKSTGPIPSVADYLEALAQELLIRATKLRADGDLVVHENTELTLHLSMKGK